MRANVFLQGVLSEHAFLVQRFYFPVQPPKVRLIVPLESGKFLGDELIQLLLDFLECFPEPLALRARQRANRLALAPARNVVGTGIRHTFPNATVFTESRERTGDILSFRDRGPFDITRRRIFQFLYLFFMLFTSGRSMLPASRMSHSFFLDGCSMGLVPNVNLGTVEPPRCRC